MSKTDGGTAEVQEMVSNPAAPEGETVHVPDKAANIGDVAVTGWPDMMKLLERSGPDAVLSTMSGVYESIGLSSAFFAAFESSRRV